jgi:hypothetical protein
MRNLTIAVISILAIGFIVAQAFAWNGGSHMGYGHGQGGYGYQASSPEYGNSNHQRFMQETARLRNQLQNARVELNNQLAQSDPNMQRVRELNEQIAVSSQRLHEIAAESNMPVQGNHGYGHRNGITRNGGQGYCWR